MAQTQNMLNLFKILFLFLLLNSCTSFQKEKKVVKIPSSIFEKELTEPDTTFITHNVNFSEAGLNFTNKLNQVSYILFEKNIAIKDNFTITFWFRFLGVDGTKGQTLFKAYSDQDNMQELTFWVGGNRLNGKLNKYYLSNNKFETSNNLTRAYFDLPLLEKGKFYFFSVTKQNNTLEVFVNATLYKTYQLGSKNELNLNKLILGAMDTVAPYHNQLEGNIKNFKIFDKVLTLNEIYSVSATNYQEIKPFNDAFELSKFNTLPE